MRRGALSALLIALVLLAIPVAAVAARLWTLGGSPLTVPIGSATVTLTFTNQGSPSSGGDEIGCVSLALPASFNVSDATIVSIGGATSGTRFAAWSAAFAAHAAVFSNPSDNLRLKGGEQAVVRVAVVSSAAGSYTWTGAARNHSQVSAMSCKGAGVFPNETLTVTVSGSTPTPTPTPRPTPSPTPTLRPTPTPTPRPTPTPMPSASSGGPSVTPSQAGLPPAGSTGLPSPSGSAAGDGGGPASAGGPGAQASVSAPPEAGDTNQSAPSHVPAVGPNGLAVRTAASNQSPIVIESLIPSLGTTQWFIPGAVLGVPGVLVLLWVALQAVAGLAWLPAARRVRGTDLHARRRLAHR